MLITPLEFRKARKQHRCYWCGETINRGEDYVRWSCYDMGWSRVKCHPECSDAWQKGCSEDQGYYGECVGHAEHHRGCLCENGRPCEC